MATDEIPVVDFSALSLENKDPFSEISKDIEELADQVYQAFSTIWICLSKKPWYSPRSGKRTQLFTSGAKGVSPRIKIYQTKIS